MRRHKKQDPDLESGKKALKSYAKYTGIAFQMLAVIGASTFIGYKLDEWYAHEVKWVTALLSVAGVCIAIFQVIRQLKD